MDAQHKKILKAISLELRHLLEGQYDAATTWQPGDLEKRLAAIGVRRDREPVSVDELAHLAPADQKARQVVDAYLKLRAEAGVSREDAVAEFVRETAYTWANRLLALRCMEARELIDEVILQKPAYGGRSLEHHRLAQRQPELCAGEDDGLLAALDKVFAEQSRHLPLLFDPEAPGVALKPSAPAIKRCVALLSGTEKASGGRQAPEDSQTGFDFADVFKAPDALGWAYQYWNTEEKDRVFTKVRTQKGAKIEGADIVPATQLYTEPYMVKFLVQNSLGATWMGMHPESKLSEKWEYYVRDADRAPVEHKPIAEVTFLDPACGSGHFLLEAFDLLYDMYEESLANGWPIGLGEERGKEDSGANAQGCDDEDASPQPSAAPPHICRAILERNLFGIDIDARAVQIAEAALWMKAAERVFPNEFPGVQTNLVAAVANHLKGPLWEEFLTGFGTESAIGNVLRRFGRTMEHIDELGSLARPEEALRTIIHDEHAKWEQARRERTDANYLFAEMRADALSGQLPFPELSDTEFGGRLLTSVRTALNTFTEKARREGRDPSRLLGRETQIGLRWIDVLGRKYDVVAANPPYMGSKNMGEALKSYTETYYTPGRRDLYAAFILRCIGLSLYDVGRVAMVTQHSWMFFRNFAELRTGPAGDAEDTEPAPSRFSRLLRDESHELLAHLGTGAFSELSGEVVNVVMFVLRHRPPQQGQMITAFRLTKMASPRARQQYLTKSDDREHGAYRIRQLSLLSVNESPVLYWFGSQLLELLATAPPLKRHAHLKEGLNSTNNAKFLRFVWEVPHFGVRWFRYAKGGGYRKWYGLERWAVDWEHFGQRMKLYVVEISGNKHWSRRLIGLEYFKVPGLTYGLVSQGCMSVRTVSGYPFDSGAVFILAEEQEWISAILNCRIASYILRALSPDLKFREGYVDLMPLVALSTRAQQLVQHATAIKQRLTERDILEYSFDPGVLLRGNTSALDAAIAVLHTIEGALESGVFAAYSIENRVAEDILDETGRPVGWATLVEGYDSMSESAGFQLEPVGGVCSLLAHCAKKRVLDNELDALRSRIRGLYGAGSRVLDDAEDSDAVDDDGDAEEEAFGAYLPIPPETLLESISRDVDIHPISVYGIVREGIDREGWRCLPEERRLTRDRLTVVTLQGLGHRWPRQIEDGDPVPDWVDQDGIIALTESGDESTLFDRLRRQPEPRRISEPHFADVMGKPLEQWLTTEFFKHHSSQFKRRPIAWQIQSGKFTARKKPSFACLVYYHKLDGDLLPKLCTQYIGPLRQRMETELRGIEAVPSAARSDRQEARRTELGDQIQELQEFDAKLREVQEAGFALKSPPEAARGFRVLLRAAAVQDAVLCLKQAWLRRLADAVQSGLLGQWVDSAREASIHADLPSWIEVAMSQLDRHCTRVGPDDSEWDSGDDPTPATAARFICTKPSQMVTEALTHANGCWAGQVYTVVIAPLRQQISEKQERQKALKTELKASTEGDTTVHAIGELRAELDRLKIEIRDLQAQVEDIQGRCDRLRALITGWHCPGVDGWESWLAEQPLYDAISSVDGRRRPPTTVQEWVAQEQSYFPDINDGVRVNIAPLQKAGLLAADVLAKKDLDKAIADRAEWRRDERRWVREGKLPQPGWWPET